MNNRTSYIRGSWGNDVKETSMTNLQNINIVEFSNNEPNMRKSHDPNISKIDSMAYPLKSVLKNVSAHDSQNMHYTKNHTHRKKQDYLFDRLQNFKNQTKHCKSIDKTALNQHQDAKQIISNIDFRNSIQYESNISDLDFAMEAIDLRKSDIGGESNGYRFPIQKSSAQNISEVAGDR